MLNDWRDDWEVDVEAARGIHELQDYLRKVAAFDAWIATHPEAEADDRP